MLLRNIWTYSKFQIYSKMSLHITCLLLAFLYSSYRGVECQETDDILKTFKALESRIQQLENKNQRLEKELEERKHNEKVLTERFSKLANREKRGKHTHILFLFVCVDALRPSQLFSVMLGHFLGWTRTVYWQSDSNPEKNLQL